MSEPSPFETFSGDSSYQNDELETEQLADQRGFGSLPLAPGVAHGTAEGMSSMPSAVSNSTTDRPSPILDLAQERKRVRIQHESDLKSGDYQGTLNVSLSSANGPLSSSVAATTSNQLSPTRLVSKLLIELRTAKRKKQGDLVAQRERQLWDGCQEPSFISALDVNSLFSVKSALSESRAFAQLAEPFLTQEIRGRRPASDTGGAPPHPKTPRGLTDTLHIIFSVSGNLNLAREYGHLKFFIDTAAQLGLKLHITTNEPGKEIIEKEFKTYAQTYELSLAKEFDGPYAEDYVEFLVNGRVEVLQPFHKDQLDQGIVDGRARRWAQMLGMPEPSTRDGFGGLTGEGVFDPRHDVEIGMRVNGGTNKATYASTAQDKGQQVAHGRAYIEGGNMLTGEDAQGRPIILVGKDAIAATQAAMLSTEAEVIQFIAQDFGVAVDQIVPVEQPGEFHIDMGILFVGNGVVFVNDSAAKFGETAFHRRGEPTGPPKGQLRAKDLAKRLEDQAADDVAAAHLNVVRGKFQDGGIFNFLNGEFVRTKDGKDVYLTNGGPKQLQEWFTETLLGFRKDLAGVIYTPIEIGQATLRDKGGLGCRAKGTSSQYHGTQQVMQAASNVSSAVESMK
jgi:hypothetical protein